MGRVDQAPARPDIGVIEQPFDRPRARPREAGVDLRDLLGDVDVERPLWREGADRFEFARRHGAEGMGGQAEISAIESSQLVARTLDEACIEIEIADEASLRIARRRAAEARMGVEHREQRQADPRRFGRGDDAPRHLGDVVVGSAVRRMMEIVKLAHAGKSGLEHFDIGLSRDRLDLIGRHFEGEAIHRLAPAPKIVRSWTATLGEAGHRALKSMAVDVGDAGHAQGMPLVALPRRRADLERGNDAGLQRHAHVATPTLRGQGFVEMKRRGCWVHQVSRR